MSATSKPVTRLIATASLAALLSGCITAAPQTPEELALVDSAVKAARQTCSLRTLQCTLPSTPTPTPPFRWCC